MKNILKKLGVLGLMVALLAPFTEIPKVNAENANCETHLQNYLFLDVNIADSFPGYEDGYTTYGNFPYTFSSTENATINVTSVTKNHPTTSNEVETFWRLYNTVYQYSALNNTYKIQSAEKYGKIFVSTDDKNYATNTILLHGRWARQDENGVEISQWEYIDEDEQKTLQDAGSNFAENMSVAIDGAKFSNNYFDSLSTSVSGNLANYFNKLVSGEYEKNEVWADNDQSYIPLEITRTVKTSYFNSDDIIFGTSFESGNDTVYQVFSKNGTPTNEDGTVDINDVEDSYSAFKAYLEAEEEAIENGFDYDDESTNDILTTELDGNVYIYTIKDSESDEIDFFRNEYYYWPFVLNVEYEVCPVVDNTPIEEKDWVLKYDANVDDPTTVTNLPKEQTAKVGTEITIDSGKPTRKDYVFQKWCETKGGSGACYNPGEKVKSTDGSPVILYAQWGSTEVVENEKTGVVSYIIGFGAVALVASGIFLISKKKNLFKQI